MDKLINKRISDLLSKGDLKSNQLVNNYSRNIISAYKLALKDIQSEIAGMFEKYGNTVILSDMHKFNRLTNMEKQIADILKELNGTVIKTTRDAIEDVYSYSFYNAGYSLESNLGVRLGFGLLTPESVRASLLNPLDRITWTKRQATHTKTFLTSIRGEITQGLIKGVGYQGIAKKVKEKTLISQHKTIRIIQTETHRAQMLGRTDAFYNIEKAADQLDININKVWVSTFDTKTRDSHKFMDSQVADSEGYFTLADGTKTLAPGLSGIAEEDINCRCTVRSEVKGFEPKLRKDNISKLLVDNMNYEEWYKLRIK